MTSLWDSIQTYILLSTNIMSLTGQASPVRDGMLVENKQKKAEVP